jgi:hypothetical protein
MEEKTYPRVIQIRKATRTALKNLARAFDFASATVGGGWNVS